MADNYCPFCGRFLMQKEFEHACDRVNVLRGKMEWCRRCGARLDVALDDVDGALCRVCSSSIDPSVGMER